MVTGGSQGIGLAAVRALTAQGHRVMAASRTSRIPADVCAVPCDVAAPDGPSRAVRVIADLHGPVEILVANAGITDDAVLPGMSERQFQRVLDTNLTGVFRTMRAVLPTMVTTGWGRVVIVSSVTGLWGAPGQANYAAAKAGLVGLCRTAAREAAVHGVTVNIIAPGFIETSMTEGLSAARKKDLLAQIPMGRPGTPEEVSTCIAWLAAEDAGYVTGAVLPVAGGLGMGW
ncbi:SDR family oxidoreductase [Streptomyces sp. AK02-04a]|nr:SDR family oxidoreductase [Streptomyces sp. AK02-04a]